MAIASAAEPECGESARFGWVAIASAAEEIAAGRHGLDGGDRKRGGAGCGGVAYGLGGWRRRRGGPECGESAHGDSGIVAFGEWRAVVAASKCKPGTELHFHRFGAGLYDEIIVGSNEFRRR